MGWNEHNIELKDLLITVAANCLSLSLFGNLFYYHYSIDFIVEYLLIDCD